jgi:hypothetical protein
MGALVCGMSPIRWFSHRGPLFGRMLLGGCLVLVLTAAPASAELSSVDAYGGQAQVLGKPVHRHVAPQGSGTQSAGRGGEQSAGTTSSASAGGGSAGGSSSSSGSHSSTGSSSATPTTPSAANGATGASASSAAGGGSGGPNGHGDGSGASPAGTDGASGAAGGAQSPPIALADSAEVSHGSLSLSSLDVLLLVIVFAGLAGVGVLIRRWSRQSQ